MIKVGITGGIGSGKTTVCKIFETLGIPVYYADDRAKALMQEDAALKAEIQQLFGAEAYDTEGKLNRGHLAKIAFSDQAKLLELNAAVHPVVFRDSAVWQARQTAPYTLKEAALTFESGSFRMVDKVITVYAPLELRLARVLQRDKTTEAAVRARMSKQMSDTEKINLADFVITNNEQASLIEQVLSVHRALLALAKSS